MKRTYILGEAKNRILVSLAAARSCNASAQLVDKGTECSCLWIITYSLYCSINIHSA